MTRNMRGSGYQGTTRLRYNGVNVCFPAQKAQRYELTMVDLIDFGLVTESQLSTDDFAGRLANQTNLAVKAIVGIKSMSVIADIAGEKSEAEKLNKIATEYVKQWLTLAYDEGIPFSKLAYQWKGSWGSLYNLYGDILLDLQLFPRIVYQQQDAWYLKVLEPFGLPLDSRHLYTKSDWQMFIASFSTPALYSSLYGRVSSWINETTTQKPLIDLYDTIEGTNAINMFTNRPVVGGHFAHLAMGKLSAAREKIRASRSGLSMSGLSELDAVRASKQGL